MIFADPTFDRRAARRATARDARPALRGSRRPALEAAAATRRDSSISSTGSATRSGGRERTSRRSKSPRRSAPSRASPKPMSTGSPSRHGRARRDGGDYGGRRSGSRGAPQLPARPAAALRASSLSSALPGDGRHGDVQADEGNARPRRVRPVSRPGCALLRSSRRAAIRPRSSAASIADIQEGRVRL